MSGRIKTTEFRALVIFLGGGFLVKRFKVHKVALDFVGLRADLNFIHITVLVDIDGFKCCL